MTEREALEQIAGKQQHALDIIRNNGFKFEDIGNERGNWQHLAFTLYTEICEISSIAESGLLEEGLEVLGSCPHGVDLDRAFCPQGCRV